VTTHQKTSLLLDFRVEAAITSRYAMYRGVLYTVNFMADDKSVSVSFRVTPRFKRLLQAAAAREYRSQTNLLETLLFAHCAKHNVEEETGKLPSPAKQGKKK
jgi:hypothetical protein